VPPQQTLTIKRPLLHLKPILHVTDSREGSVFDPSYRILGLSWARLCIQQHDSRHLSGNRRAHVWSLCCPGGLEYWLRQSVHRDRFCRLSAATWYLSQYGRQKHVARHRFCRALAEERQKRGSISARLRLGCRGPSEAEAFFLILNQRQLKRAPESHTPIWSAPPRCYSFRQPKTNPAELHL